MNTFPTALNDWDSGEVIESAWADALEAKIGIDSSAVATSLDYLIKNTSSKLGKIASLAVTDSNFIVGNGTNWVAESGATARTSLGLGTGDSPTFAGVYTDTILEKTAANGVVIDGTTIKDGGMKYIQVAITDDTIWSITPPHNGGLAMIHIGSDNGGAGAPAWGSIVAFRVPATVYCTLLVGNTTYNAVGTTALTAGAGDGVDGKVNIWQAADGTFGIKNRLGTNQTFIITFLSVYT